MKKVLFINHEISPFVPDSELAVMGRRLPQSVQDSGCEIRTFMPKWGHINERRGQLHEVQRLSGMNIIINDTDHPLIIKVASIPQTKIQVYFIDNEEYFIKAKSDDDVPTTSCGERAIFFARGVIETMKKLRWSPDIIHCQGWMSAFVPLYIKQAYQDEPSVCNAKIVSSLFNSTDDIVLEEDLKQRIRLCYPGQTSAFVLDVLHSKDEKIRKSLIKEHDELCQSLKKRYFNISRKYMRIHSERQMAAIRRQIEEEQ